MKSFNLSIVDKLRDSFYGGPEWDGTPRFFNWIRESCPAGARILNLGAGPGDLPDGPGSSKRDLRVHRIIVVECEPSYLVFSWPTFLVGILIERALNRFHALRHFRSNIFGCLKKTG